MAIISYLTVIGLIIAYFMNNSKHNAFTKFHIGQSLRAFIAVVLLTVASTILVLVTVIAAIGYLGYVGWVFAILGILNAVNGKTEKLPIIGNIG